MFSLKGMSVFVVVSADDFILQTSKHIIFLDGTLDIN